MEGRAIRLLLATRSRHKVREVRRIVSAMGAREGRAGPSDADPAGAELARIEIVTLDEVGVPWSPEEEDLEPHDTFEANAESKARHFAALTGLATAADDSGLVVDALDGRPGVRSKRFAPLDRYPGMEQDEANNRHLLALLAGRPMRERAARYVCVACLATERFGVGTGARSADAGGPGVRFFRGESPGRILTRPRGAGGFGYDPLFLDDALGRAYAEMRPDEKNARSHRGRAFRALARLLTP